eukprot:1258037-Amphidinium_carterae.1
MQLPAFASSSETSKGLLHDHPKSSSNKVHSYDPARLQLTNLLKPGGMSHRGHDAPDPLEPSKLQNN